MAKSFKQLVSEVAQPKGGDEKAFKDQHTIQKFNHPVALDHQFTGEIDKERRMRPADYTAPADAAAYDKATGIDDMGATLGEEAEQIDELKKSTLGSYIKKAGPDREKQKAMAARHDAAGMDADKDADMYKHYAKSQRAMDKAKNRKKGIEKAVDRLTNESQKKSLEKKLAAASAPSKKGKEAVTLPKAPWDKMKEATEIVLESREMIDEAVRAGNMRLKDGSSVKIKNEDAKLLNQMFKDLNSSNRRQMEKVMMTDKAGFEEILGFAREAL